MIRRDAEELAGQFYDANRTDVFRIQWPDQMQYVRRNWKHFVVHVRQVYCELLAQERVAQADKDAMYDALIDDAHNSASPFAAAPLQVFPNTEKFVGDKAENRRTDQLAFDSGALERAFKRALLRGAAHRTFN